MGAIDNHFHVFTVCLKLKYINRFVGIFLNPGVFEMGFSSQSNLTHFLTREFYQVDLNSILITIQSYFNLTQNLWSKLYHYVHDKYESTTKI